MKFILIAVYLVHGGADPTLQKREFADLGECQALASRYVKQVISGQARAFCLPLKNKKRAV